MGEPLEYFHEVVLCHKDDGCLIWPFTRDRNGYAKLRYEGRLAIVSRLVCEYVHGPAPTAEHQSAHTCGKGHEGCVNPRHLRWATQAENEADKIIHGTSNRGERHGCSKLTEAEVHAIRQMSGTHCEIAAKFGVAQSAVSNIRSGKAWRHITEEAEA